MKKTLLIDVLKFGAKLFVLLLLTFILHQVYLNWKNLSWNSNLIIESYLSNFILVLITYGVLMFFREKKNESLGFIFLYGFFLKMAVFMIFFNPTYKADSEMTGLEFFAFFLPYSVCLAFETVVIVRILNRD